MFQERRVIVIAEAASLGNVCSTITACEVINSLPGLPYPGGDGDEAGILGMYLIILSNLNHPGSNCFQLKDSVNGLFSPSSLPGSYLRIICSVHPSASLNALPSLPAG